MSPSPHQDSPKVPWPVITAKREPECGVLYIDSQPWPKKAHLDEAETYIPISALDSDETRELLYTEYMKRLPGAESTRYALEGALEAAIQAVTGGDHE